jgi:hypothetical protein
MSTFAQNTGTGGDYINYRKDLWEYDQVANAWTCKTDLNGAIGKGK